MTNRLIKPTKEQMVEDKQKGLSTYDMAVKRKCSRPTISMWLQSYGLGTPRVVPPPKEKIIPLIDKKLTQPEIAKILGIAEHTLYVLMRKYGLKTATAIKRDQIDEAKRGVLLMLKEKSQTAIELANQTDYGVSTISRWLNQFKKSGLASWCKFALIWSYVDPDARINVNRKIDIKLIPFTGDIPQCGFIVEHQLAAA